MPAGPFLRYYLPSAENVFHGGGYFRPKQKQSKRIIYTNIDMLILTRRPGEALYLDDNIKITVLSVQGRQVKLGLEIPAETTVYREEVYLKIKEQNRLALENTEQDLLAATELWQKKEKK